MEFNFTLNQLQSLGCTTSPDILGDCLLMLQQTAKQRVEHNSCEFKLRLLDTSIFFCNLTQDVVYLWRHYRDLALHSIEICAQGKGPWVMEMTAVLLQAFKLLKDYEKMITVYERNTDPLPDSRVLDLYLDRFFGKMSFVVQTRIAATSKSPILPQSKTYFGDLQTIRYVCKDETMKILRIGLPTEAELYRVKHCDEYDEDPLLKFEYEDEERPMDVLEAAKDAEAACMLMRVDGLMTVKSKTAGPLTMGIFHRKRK